MSNNQADWVIMASSFHWTDPKKSLPEFNRILTGGGVFYCDLESSPHCRGFGF